MTSVVLALDQQPVLLLAAVGDSTGASAAGQTVPTLSPAEEEALRLKRLRRGKKLLVEDIPYVTLAPEEVHIDGGCVFKGCPRGHPYVYYMTSYRNRGASYNRWVRSVLADVQSPVNKVPVQCLCMAVADYNDVVSGAPIEAALGDWPHDKAVISLKGPFSRAGGFQRCIDHLVTTPKNESLMFFVDADMIAYPGLLNRILQYTAAGVVRAGCSHSTP